MFPSSPSPCFRAKTQPRSATSQPRPRLQAAPTSRGGGRGGGRGGVKASERDSTCPPWRSATCRDQGRSSCAQKSCCCCCCCSRWCCHAERDNERTCVAVAAAAVVIAASVAANPPAVAAVPGCLRYRPRQVLLLVLLLYLVPAVTFYSGKKEQAKKTQ